MKTAEEFYEELRVPPVDRSNVRICSPHVLDELIATLSEREEQAKRLTKCLAFVPAAVYIKACEDAGYGNRMKLLDEFDTTKVTP